MKPSPNLLAGMLLLLGSLDLQAAPPAFQATYDINKAGLTLGSMTATLSYNANQYTYLKQSRANGLAALLSNDNLTERSSGTRHGEQLQSLQYLHQHKSRSKNRRDQFSFNTPNQVSGQYRNEAYQLQVPAGTVDPALMELRIMDDLKANRPLRYAVTEKGELKNYVFQRQGREVLQLPAGRYECEKIHLVRDDGKRKTTIWLAPALNYVVARIRHDEKGDVVESSLSGYVPR